MPLTFESLGDAPTPEQLLEIYNSGFQGVRVHPAEYRIHRLMTPGFYDVFPEARNAGAGQLSLPYKACLAEEPEFGRYEAQTTGDCVSHATRNAGMIDYCCDSQFGQTEYLGRFATENIYGARGHGGQGASCDRLAVYVGPDGKGGFLTRKRYEGGGKSVDLSTYNGNTGHNWGSSGTPSWLNQIAAENKAQRVFNCKSMEEARDALAFGFGVSLCSGFGFASTRNDDGVSEQRGSWAHAMAWVACDDTDFAHQKYQGMLFLIQNSWGVFNSGGKRHEQPDGSFFVRPAVAKRMIAAGGAWVVSSVQGYNRVLLQERMATIQKLSLA
jgi:hypothetical protein